MKKFILLFLIVPLIATSQYAKIPKYSNVNKGVKNEISKLIGPLKFSRYVLSIITDNQATVYFTFHKNGATINAKVPVTIKRGTDVYNETEYQINFHSGNYQYKIYGTEEKINGHFEYNNEGFLIKATYYHETDIVNGEWQFDKNKVKKVLHYNGEKYAQHQVGWSFDSDSPSLEKTYLEMYYYSSSGEMYEIWDFTKNIHKEYLGSGSEKQTIITTLVDRKMHGPSTIQRAGQQPLTLGQYINGLKEGTWYSNYHQGELLSKGVYLNDDRTGVWEYYFESGNLKSNGTYTNDVKTGDWHSYSESGEITDTESYNAYGDKKGITEESLSVEDFEVINLLAIQEQFGIRLFDYESEKITIKSAYLFGTTNGKVECYYPDGTYLGYYYFDAEEFMPYDDLKIQYKSGKTFLKIKFIEDGIPSHITLYNENGEVLMDEKFD